MRPPPCRRDGVASVIEAGPMRVLTRVRGEGESNKKARKVAKETEDIERTSTKSARWSVCGETMPIGGGRPNTAWDRPSFHSTLADFGQVGADFDHMCLSSASLRPMSTKEEGAKLCASKLSR